MPGQPIFCPAVRFGGFMKQVKNFTQGPILKPLLLFAMPVLGTLFLQFMYGAVDLMVVG